MKVMKFGGSSVGTPAMIERVIEICTAASRTQRIAVIVSAFQGVTNQLISLSNQAYRVSESWRDALTELERRHLDVVERLIPVTNRPTIVAEIKVMMNELGDTLTGIALLREVTPRTLDLVMSFGERLSATIIAAAMSASHPELVAQFTDARFLITTDEKFGNASPLMEPTTRAIRDHFARIASEEKANGKPIVPIITGFIGSTHRHETTTLGRGGSDYTSALVAAAMNAEDLEIWTDVDGILTADPRKVPKAFPLEYLTYEEALELCHFGAKVIYAPTMQPVLEKKIPLAIKNTFNPTIPGTRVGDKPPQHQHAITAISSIDDIVLLRIQGSGMMGVVGIAMRLFGALARERISVILITQASSEHTICLAVAPEQSEQAADLINQEFLLERQAGLINDVVTEHNLSVISIVGENMRNRPGISGRLFSALGRNGINVIAIAQGSSELNISTVIERSQEVKALRVIHDEFFLSHYRTINAFIVGSGLIGGTLLKQIEEHSEHIAEDHIDLRVVGVCNRRTMTINPAGIPGSHLLDAPKSGEKGDVTQFVTSIKGLNLPNAVFVDCTASDEVTRLYPEILRSHIAIVTPNKRAQSGTMEEYLQLKDISRRTDAPFLFETSVGAGLPVISTLRDLRKSGDRIIKIEAVLSGTLSYLFNSFTGGKPFSQLVREAQELGFTEPDPRDDLCGLDVGRKIIILAREAGANLEQADVVIDNLVPPAARDAKDIATFWATLAEYDDAMETRRSQASSRGARLCYIASFSDSGGAQTSLSEIDANHPFWGLSGSDNIISFTTERYRERPLVVKGPGAGAEVTAAGVLADILRLARIS